MGPDEINHKGRQFSEVPGNQKLHCIKADDESTKLLTNTRSCYCCKCRYGEFEQCINKDYVDDWKEIQIEMLTQSSDKTTNSEPAHESARVESIAEMATEGSIVAIAAEGDPNYDYYLPKVISTEPELLTENEEDDYGTITADGYRILRGHFFVRENLLNMTYRLDDHKTAIVHIRSYALIWRF